MLDIPVLCFGNVEAPKDPRNGEFQHFRVSKSARPGTPVGRPRVTGLSKNGALVNWEMRHRYRRGGMFLVICIGYTNNSIE